MLDEKRGINKIFSSYSDIIGIIIKNKFYFLISIITDFCFLIVTGSIFADLFSKIMNHLASIQVTFDPSAFDPNNQAMMQKSLGSLISQQETITFHTNQIINLSLLLYLLIFICWIIFQGINTKLCLDICSKRKNSFVSFFIGFIIINIVWFGLLLFMIYFTLGTLSTPFLDYAPSFAKFLFTAILPATIMLSGYFAIISYSLLSVYNGFFALKNSFIFGFKQILSLFKTFIYGLFPLIILLPLLYLSQSMVLSNIIFLMIIVMISFSRIYLLKNNLNILSKK